MDVNEAKWMGKIIEEVENAFFSRRDVELSVDISGMHLEGARSFSITFKKVEGGD